MVAPRVDNQLSDEDEQHAEVRRCVDAMIFTVTDLVAGGTLSRLNRDLDHAPTTQFVDFVRLFREIQSNRRTVQRIMENADFALQDLFMDLVETFSPLPTLEQGLHNAILDGQTHLVEENLKEWPDLSERTDDGDLPIHLVRIVISCVAERFYQLHDCCKQCRAPF